MHLRAALCAIWPGRDTRTRHSGTDSLSEVRHGRRGDVALADGGLAKAGLARAPFRGEGDGKQERGRAVTASGNINAAMDGQTHPSSTLDSITNGTRLSVHFSSKSPDWGTPPEFFEQLDSLFHFTLDVCATAENAKCARYFTLEQNGLAQRWTGNCWMNPPYGRKIGEWIAKAAASVRSGDATVVCLLPARTDTAWWHRHIQPILAG